MPMDPSLWDAPAPSPLEIPLNPIRYDNSGRVNDDLENLIDRSVGYGDVLEQEFRDVGPQFWRQYLRYMGIGDQAYQDLMANPGYTPDEASRITDYGNLDNLRYTQDEANQLFLSPEEQWAITGDPFGEFAYMNPDAVRGQWSDFRDRGREAIQGANLGVDPGYAGRLRAILNRTGADSEIDKDALRLRPGFLDEFQMGDNEVRDLANLGARSASSRWDAAYDDTQRRANAAGTMSPAALAVLRGRLDRNSNIDAADAATRATLEGKGLQRDLLGRGEQMRLGSEQFITDAELQRALSLGNLALSAEGDVEGRRFQGEQARMNASLGHETNVGNMGLGMEQYLQDTGQSIYRNADTTRSNRASGIASNRQAAAEAGQQNFRDYGFGVSDRTRAGAQTVADTRRADEQEGRGYAAGMGQFNAGMYQDAANRRADTAVGMTNAQLGGSADRRQRRGAGFWERTLLG